MSFSLSAEQVAAQILHALATGAISLADLTDLDARLESYDVFPCKCHVHWGKHDSVTDTRQFPTPCIHVLAKRMQEARGQLPDRQPAWWAGRLLALEIAGVRKIHNDDYRGCPLPDQFGTFDTREDRIKGMMERVADGKQPFHPDDIKNFPHLTEHADGSSRVDNEQERPVKQSKRKREAIP